MNVTGDDIFKGAIAFVTMLMGGAVGWVVSKTISADKGIATLDDRVSRLEKNSLTKEDIREVIHFELSARDQRADQRRAEFDERLRLLIRQEVTSHWTLTKRELETLVPRIVREVLDQWRADRP